MIELYELNPHKMTTPQEKEILSETINFSVNKNFIKY